MAARSSLLLAFVALASSLVNAQEVTGTYPATPLASKHYAYPSGIPYKVDTDVGLIRGSQHGYNICNSTTENQNSLCQTSIFNSLGDFCLWGPGEPDSIVSNTEGEMVAWCSKPGHGTRLIPDGALTGVQFIKTPDYIQVVGFIDQSKINIKTGDTGGEMDPHGADLRGNPMGGLVYSNAFTGSYVQVIEWHNFMGSDSFCLKACDPAGPNAAHFCEHRLDRIGCAYNAPNAAKDGVFESCQGENQDYPGVYTADGAVHTYTQPPEEQGAITSMPYTARIPASSNCTPFSSAALFAALPTATSVPTSTAASSTGLSTAKSTAVSSGLSTAKATTTGTGTKTSSSSSASPSSSSGAQSLAISGISLFGVALSAIFFS